jgi:hypothetical protein
MAARTSRERAAALGPIAEFAPSLCSFPDEKAHLKAPARTELKSRLTSEQLRAKNYWR